MAGGTRGDVATYARDAFFSAVYILPATSLTTNTASTYIIPTTTRSVASYILPAAPPAASTTATGIVPIVTSPSAPHFFPVCSSAADNASSHTNYINSSFFSAAISHGAQNGYFPIFQKTSCERIPLPARIFSTTYTSFTAAVAAHACSTDFSAVHTLPAASPAANTVASLFIAETSAHICSALYTPLAATLGDANLAALFIAKNTVPSYSPTAHARSAAFSATI